MEFNKSWYLYTILCFLFVAGIAVYFDLTSEPKPSTNSETYEVCTTECSQRNVTEYKVLASNEYESLISFKLESREILLFCSGVRPAVIERQGDKYLVKIQNLNPGAAKLTEDIQTYLIGCEAMDYETFKKQPDNLGYSDIKPMPSWNFTVTSPEVLFSY